MKIIQKLNNSFYFHLILGIFVFYLGFAAMLPEVFVLVYFTSYLTAVGGFWTGVALSMSSIGFIICFLNALECKDRSA